jgi:hypothetical protein
MPTLSELQSTPFVGRGVGLVGALVGDFVGRFVGCLVGGLVGRTVGWADGRAEGEEEGSEEGADEGPAEGPAEGGAEGAAEGPDEGAGVATGFFVGVAEMRVRAGAGAIRIFPGAGHFIIIIIILKLLHMPFRPALPSRSLGARIPRTALPAPARPGGEAPAWTGSPPGDSSAATTIVSEKGGERRARRKGAKTRISSDKREANEG